jgi:hypothetical protein
LIALAVIVAVCVVAAAVFVYGEFRWKSGTTALRGRLEAARLPTELVPGGFRVGGRFKRAA